MKNPRILHVVGMILLTASLFSLPLGVPLVPLGWLIGFLAFGILNQLPETRRGAQVGFLVLSTCTLSAIFLAGTVRYLPLPFTPTPEMRMVGSGLGAAATYYAAAALALLIPLAAPRLIAQIGVFLLVIGPPASYAITAIGPPRLEDVSPAVFPGLFVLVSLAGIAVTTGVLVWQVVHLLSGSRGLLETR